MYSERNVFEALRSVIDAVKYRAISEQSLRSADVARGLIPSYMLFSGLHRESEGRLQKGILALTHDSAGYLSLEIVRACQEGRRGTSEAHGHSKSLSTAHAELKALDLSVFVECEVEQIRAQYRNHFILVQEIYGVPEVVQNA